MNTTLIVRALLDAAHRNFKLAKVLPPPYREAMAIVERACRDDDPLFVRYGDE